MSNVKYMWRCAWKRDGDCSEMFVASDPLDFIMAGWRLIYCEDGRDRVFCPKHSPKLQRPEEEHHG